MEMWSRHVRRPRFQKLLGSVELLLPLPLPLLLVDDSDDDDDDGEEDDNEDEDDDDGNANHDLADDVADVADVADDDDEDDEDDEDGEDCEDEDWNDVYHVLVAGDAAWLRADLHALLRFANCLRNQKCQGFAREHRAKRYMITAHSSLGPQNRQRLHRELCARAKEVSQKIVTRKRGFLFYSYECHTLTAWGSFEACWVRVGSTTVPPATFLSRNFFDTYICNV